MHPIHKRSTSKLAEWGWEDRVAPEGGHMGVFAESSELLRAPPRSTPVSDKRLLDRVQSALARAPHIDVTAVVVIVQDGIVRLIGEVPQRDDRRAVNDVVAQVQGVSIIRNDLAHPRKTG